MRIDLSTGVKWVKTINDDETNVHDILMHVYTDPTTTTSLVVAMAQVKVVGKAVLVANDKQHH